MTTVAELPAPAQARLTGPRFTVDGHPELEAALASICAKVRDGVLSLLPPEKMDALVLAGGYGRGEGGVLAQDGRQHPYNDLEFYLFLGGPVLLNERKFGPAIHHLAEQLSGTAGVEVEIKIISREKLRRSEPSMFFYDLVARSRTIAGSADIFDALEHHRDSTNIPFCEATRLLMNRLTGLLLARQRLGKGPFDADDADFVGRNIAKAQLALGDAMLVMHRQYHWSCRERHRRLQELTLSHVWWEDLVAHHSHGVAFKLHPVQRAVADREVLTDELIDLLALSQVVWLCIESMRLGCASFSIRGYVLDQRNKLPELSNAARNLLLNLRRKAGAKLFRHPRERLIRWLPQLLWLGSTKSAEEAYLRLWRVVQ